jgi:hypothetical protein
MLEEEAFLLLRMYGYVGQIHIFKVCLVSAMGS